MKKIMAIIVIFIALVFLVATCFLGKNISYDDYKNPDIPIEDRTSVIMPIIYDTLGWLTEFVEDAKNVAENITTFANNIFQTIGEAINSFFEFLFPPKEASASVQYIIKE